MLPGLARQRREAEAAQRPAPPEKRDPPERRDPPEKRDPPEQRSVELWTMDEHRVGLKPILRKVWARKGQRPVVEVRPRYRWLYIYGFVQPETGETVFWLAPSVNTETFRAILERFLQEREAPVMLVLDQAGWHVSDEIRRLERERRLELVHLPPYSPQLQPAEHLWQLCDEPVANRVFDSVEALEEVVAERCCRLSEEPERIRRLTLFHWWPGGADHTQLE